MLSSNDGSAWLMVLLVAVLSFLGAMPGRTQYVPDAAPNEPGEARTETDGADRNSLSGGLIAPQVSFDLPSGRRGMTPGLGLVYSPGTANGVLGAGWNLQFGSRIDRMSAMRGLDAVAASESSRYFVDGTELIAVVGQQMKGVQLVA